LICDVVCIVNFTIEDLNNHLIIEKGKVKTVSNNLAITLLSIGYSTLRGIVLTKSCGIVESGIVLPIVEPKTLLDNLVKRGSTKSSRK
jgi:hypothetical protein